MGSLVTIRVTPGPPSTPASRHRATELQRLHREEFDRVRAQAEKWRNGLAGLLGLITAVNLIKGPDVLYKLPDPARYAIASLQLAALLTATIGACFAMRAAFGLPSRRDLTGRPQEFAVYRSEILARAVRDLWLAIAATLVTLLLLGAAASIGWFAGERHTAIAPPGQPSAIARVA